MNNYNFSNIPWEEKPQNLDEIIWRSTSNPIITKKAVKGANSIFNSAVVPFNGEFAGVFRVDDNSRILRLHSGFSKDGISWNINQKPLEVIDKDGCTTLVKGYDPRVCFIEDRYYVSYCNCVNGPTVAIAYTFDFVDFYDLGNSFLPFNRNGVLFPRKINGKYAMVSRPSDNGHTPFGDIYYSESPDFIHWGCHKHVMRPTAGWQELKIGAGPTPIETEEGWLLIYHGVLLSCNGYVYSAGAAILDIDEPWRVLYRTKPYIIAPQEMYERVGDVPNVVFPCSALLDKESGKLALYYGAADTTVCLAYTYLADLLDFIKMNTVD